MIRGMIRMMTMTMTTWWDHQPLIFEYRQNETIHFLLLFLDCHWAQERIVAACGEEGFCCATTAGSTCKPLHMNKVKEHSNYMNVDQWFEDDIYMTLIVWIRTQHVRTHVSLLLVYSCRWHKRQKSSSRFVWIPVHWPNLLCRRSTEHIVGWMLVSLSSLNISVKLKPLQLVKFDGKSNGWECWDFQPFVIRNLFKFGWKCSAKMLLPEMRKHQSQLDRSAMSHCPWKIYKSKCQAKSGSWILDLMVVGTENGTAMNAI